MGVPERRVVRLIHESVSYVRATRLAATDHITCVLKAMLTDGSGRRNRDSSVALAKKYGSCTAASVKSAPAGMPMPTRMVPWFRAC